MGTGGMGMIGAMPNAMFGSRLNCRACHTKPGMDLKGNELVEATKATCIACHGQDYEHLYDQWRNEIDTYLREAEEAVARVEKQVDDWRSRGAEVPATILETLHEASVNVQLYSSCLIRQNSEKRSASGPAAARYRPMAACTSKSVP